MHLVIMAVRDSAAEAFMQPFFATTVGMAVRSFGDEVKRADSVFAKHPTDYILYQLGSFNDSDGSFVMEPRPVQVSRGVDHVESA